MAQEKTVSRYVVGIDAGGTSLRIAVAELPTQANRMEVRGNAAPDGGPDTLHELMDKALGEARISAHEVDCVCAGITKITRAGVRKCWQATLGALFPNLAPEAIKIVPDFVVAFHGAIPTGVGVAVIAGTGSVIYGEDGRSQSLRIGGRGWEYGDEGSGAWLTAEMVRRTLRALDGLEQPSPLTEAVVERIGTRDAGEVAEGVRQTVLAQGRGFLVPLALELAHQGEKEAINLFVGAGGWLAAYVRAAQQQLSLDANLPLTIATIGGLWEAGELLYGPFRTVIARWLPRAVIVAPDASPVIGAVRLASLVTEPYTQTNIAD